MTLILYILFPLKPLLCLLIQNENIECFSLKMEKCFWIRISYFDNQLISIQTSFVNLEPISLRILPPLPFG